MFIQDALSFADQTLIECAGHTICRLSKLQYDIGGNGLNGVMWFDCGSWFFREYDQTKVYSAATPFDVLALAVTSI